MLKTVKNKFKSGFAVKEEEGLLGAGLRTPVSLDNGYKPFQAKKSNDMTSIDILTSEDTKMHSSAQKGILDNCFFSSSNEATCLKATMFKPCDKHRSSCIQEGKEKHQKCCSSFSSREETNEVLYYCTKDQEGLFQCQEGEIQHNILRQNSVTLQDPSWSTNQGETPHHMPINSDFECLLGDNQHCDETSGISPLISHSTVSELPGSNLQNTSRCNSSLFFPDLPGQICGQNCITEIMKGGKFSRHQRAEITQGSNDCPNQSNLVIHTFSINDIQDKMATNKKEKILGINEDCSDNQLACVQENMQKLSIRNSNRALKVEVESSFFRTAGNSLKGSMTANLNLLGKIQ